MRTIILGTDWWTDCDDIAAVRIACRAHRKGFWNFAGAVIDACMPYSAASLNAFLTAEGCGEIPVAIGPGRISRGISRRIRRISPSAGPTASPRTTVPKSPFRC